MSQKKKPDPSPAAEAIDEIASVPFPDLNVKAVVCFRVDHLSGDSFDLKIEGGIVQSMTRIGRGPDLPAAAIGAAQKSLWAQIRTQQFPKAES